MFRRMVVASLFTGAVLACSEGTGPAADAPLSDAPVMATGTPHHLKWNTATGPARFSAVVTSQGSEIPLALNSDLGPLAAEAGDLETYQVAFWAVRGLERKIVIKYMDRSVNGDEKNFLKLEVTEPVQQTDGSEIAVGDSVLITVSVDPVDLAVHLEPSGLQFGSANPTKLEISYAHANQDFNGDGVVDEDDQYVEQELLGTWFQQEVGAAWEGIDSKHNLDKKKFELILEHFSGYAVAW